MRTRRSSNPDVITKSQNINNESNNESSSTTTRSNTRRSSGSGSTSTTTTTTTTTAPKLTKAQQKQQLQQQQEQQQTTESTKVSKRPLCCSNRRRTQMQDEDDDCTTEESDNEHVVSKSKPPPPSRGGRKPRTTITKSTTADDCTTEESDNENNNQIVNMHKNVNIKKVVDKHQSMNDNDHDQHANNTSPPQVQSQQLLSQPLQHQQQQPLPQFPQLPHISQDQAKQPELLTEKQNNLQSSLDDVIELQQQIQTVFNTIQTNNSYTAINVDKSVHLDNQLVLQTKSTISNQSHDIYSNILPNWNLQTSTSNQSNITIQQLFSKLKFIPSTEAQISTNEIFNLVQTIISELQEQSENVMNNETVESISSQDLNRSSSSKSNRNDELITTLVLVSKMIIKTIALLSKSSPLTNPENYSNSIGDQSIMAKHFQLLNDEQQKSKMMYIELLQKCSNIFPSQLSHNPFVSI